MATEQELRDALKGAIHLRARMYYYIFCTLRDELGEEKATQLMKKAIRKGGEAVGPRFAKHAPDDLEGLKDSFIDWVPDKASMFQPEVVCCNHGDGLTIQFHACPLKEAYEEMGLSDEEKEKILAIAAAIDGGVFETAGFKFQSETWKPGQTGCCRLTIKPGPKA